jgi:hypothetical protein
MRTKSGKTVFHILALTANFSLLNKLLKFVRKNSEEDVLRVRDNKEGSLPVHVLLNNARGN